MRPSPIDPSMPAPLAPVPSGTRTGGGDPPRAARPGISCLWEAIRRARAALEARELRDGWIGHRFETLIRPRERTFTAAVCRMTERLVTHHEGTALGPDERTLLGLWINENLQSLAAHPFAPREAADALALRWRGHLGANLHPLDVPLASLYARQGGGSASGRAGTGATTARARVDPDGGTPGADGRDPNGRDAGERDANGRDANDTDGESEDGPDTARRDPDRIVSRLFRRLARVLHPDREPDEARRLVKHRLMSDCLRARDEHDIDTLLSLHVEHVGALPDDVAGDDPAELARLLRRQLGRLHERLRHHGGGDLVSLIVARYAADDRQESERRFAAHAGALDDEIERFEDLERRVVGVEGLREALRARRALELDRLAIDELTGVTGD